MIWNCDGKVDVIEFEYNKGMQGYACWIAYLAYARKKGLGNAGPWDWYRKGYNLEYDEWMEI